MVVSLGGLAAAAVRKADGCGAMYYELVVDAACGQQRREAPACLDVDAGTAVGPPRRRIGLQLYSLYHGTAPLLEYRYLATRVLPPGSLAGP